MNPREQPILVQLIWAVTIVAFLFALFTMRWSMAFISAATLGLSMAPALLAARLDLRLPVPFLVFTVAFTFSTLFLGEVLDFYERYWWWDVVLHGSSAVAFGMIGFTFIFYLFEGDRYAAPPWAMGFFGFCFAVTIGALWEIFEYTMDQTFGLNMQKSGLRDTMWDLIVDVIGGILGAGSGSLYLYGQKLGGPGAVIEDFVSKNRRLFRKLRR